MPGKNKNPGSAADRTSRRSKQEKSPATSRSKSKRNIQRKNNHKSGKAGHRRRYIVGALLLAGFSFILYCVFLDHQVTQRFEGRIWKLPAHVYSRPLEVYAGKALSRKQLLYELDYLGYQEVKQLPTREATYRTWDDYFEVKTRDFRFWDGRQDSTLLRLKLDDGKVTELVDPLTEKPLGLVRFDAGYLTGIFPSNAQDRVLLRIDEVPDMFIKTLLLTEDRRFFEHHGIDPRAIARAFVANIVSGQAVQGGSTLTQQLVKNLFLSQEKTLTRKINEAIMAVMLELHYDKKLILETYLNEVYLGQDGKRSIHGFGLASQFYFGKTLKELSLDQMALLVGMVKGASYYNPKRNPEHARERRNIILQSMLNEGLITERQFKIQSSKPITTVRHASAGKYPAFIDAVKVQLQHDYRPDDLQSEGLTIFTTLDPYIQHVTEQSVRNTLSRLSKNNELQAAAVVVSPDSGDLLALVGDRNPTFKGFNRAINAQRPVGSLIKPIIYLTALDSSKGYTLASMLDDSPLTLKQPGHEDWQPLNYDRKFHGEITMYEALLHSYNIPAVRTAMDVGLDKVRDTAISLGADERFESYPSMTLGASPMSPVEVASIYQSFAADGFNSPIRSVTAVLDKEGNPLERYPLDIRSGADPDAIAVVNSALIDVAKYGTAKHLAEALPLQVAGKTGTSDDLRDSWFAGFSGDLVTVVWVGYDDNRPTGFTGSSGAMRVWKNIMKAAAYKDYTLPERASVETAWIDLKDGLLSGQGCENAVELHFLKDTKPEQYSENADNCKQGTNWFLDLFR